MIFSLLYRIEHALICSIFFPFRLIAYIFYPFYFIITYFILSIDINPEIKIGAGLFIHNRGIVISNLSKIGENFRILGPITIGVDLNEPMAPSIGNNCTMCTGARAIGKITIGDNVIIGANAVVVKDVPSNCIVGGVPARVLKQL